MCVLMSLCIYWKHGHRLDSSTSIFTGRVSCVCVCVCVCVCTRKRAWETEKKSDRQTEEGEAERELLTYSYCKSQLELNLYRRAKSSRFFTVSTLLQHCVCMCAWHCVCVWVFLWWVVSLWLLHFKSRTHLTGHIDTRTLTCMDKLHWRERLFPRLHFSLQHAHTKVFVSAYAHVHTHI